MSKFRRAPYPHLTSPKGPKRGWVWGVWRWCGADTVPPDSWWFIMEPSRKGAESYARLLNRLHADMGHPKAFAAKVRL
jgi:hypothetical protein